MPKDNIERAIPRATGGAEGSDAYEAIVYEGDGPDGVAIIVEELNETETAPPPTCGQSSRSTPPASEPRGRSRGSSIARASSTSPLRGRPRTTSCWRPPTPAPRTRRSTAACGR